MSLWGFIRSLAWQNLMILSHYSPANGSGIRVHRESCLAPVWGCGGYGGFLQRCLRLLGLWTREQDSASITACSANPGCVPQIIVLHMQPEIFKSMFHITQKVLKQLFSSWNRKFKVTTFIASSINFSVDVWLVDLRPVDLLICTPAVSFLSWFSCSKWSFYQQSWHLWHSS